MLQQVQVQTQSPGAGNNRMKTFEHSSSFSNLAGKIQAERDRSKSPNANRQQSKLQQLHSQYQSATPQMYSTNAANSNKGNFSTSMSQNPPNRSLNRNASSPAMSGNSSASPTGSYAAYAKSPQPFHERLNQLQEQYKQLPKR